jgi:hypothetical protein
VKLGEGSFFLHEASTSKFISFLHKLGRRAGSGPDLDDFLIKGKLLTATRQDPMCNDDWSMSVLIVLGLDRELDS